MRNGKMKEKTELEKLKEQRQYSIKGTNHIHVVRTCEAILKDIEGFEYSEEWEKYYRHDVQAENVLDIVKELIKKGLK